MNGAVPHLTQYQGSKRNLAGLILRYLPKKFARLVEPFAGMAAVSMAAAFEGRAAAYLLNDLNAPLIGLLAEATQNPGRLFANYQRLWSGQFTWPDGHLGHYNKVRELYNSGEKKPENLLYLLARCVKGSPRYNASGGFNQAPDKRRHGANPAKIRANAERISALLQGRVEFQSRDYREILAEVRPGDIVYLDPPYQGISGGRDSRYLAGVAFSEFVEAIRKLDATGAAYLISYDGRCGDKKYGLPLPDGLDCAAFLLEAGRSSQSTLLGRKEVTYETLYVSRRLIKNCEQAGLTIGYQSLMDYCSGKVS